MFYLLLAIASSALVSIIMRLSDRKVTGNIAMLTVNYLMCFLVSAVNMGFGNLFPQSQALPTALAIGCINGALYLGGFVLLQVNIQRNGVVLSSTFMKLGLLVSIAVSVLFFREIPDVVQIIGFVLAVAAILLINFKGNTGDKADFKLGLILLLLVGGMADTMSKVFKELGDPALEPQFLAYTFLVALILCTILMWKKGQKPGRWEILFGLLIGIPNFFCTKFLLGALEEIPAVIVYPVCSVATILTVSLVGVLAFRERLEKRQWIGMGLILVALVLLGLMLIFLGANRTARSVLERKFFL